MVAPASAATSRQDPSLDPQLMERIEQARPLDDVRTAISETEPEYCSAELVSEINPNARNRSSIMAGPPKFVVEQLPPGSTWRHCVLMHNRSPQPRTVELDTLDIVGSLDPTVRLETEQEPRVVGTWIRLPTTRLELAPGELVLLPYLIEVPDEVPGGTATGGIAIRDVSAQQTAAGARVTRTLILQLQITFPGGDPAELDIRGVRSTRFIWTGRTPERVRSRFVVANLGDELDVVNAELQIKGLFGHRDSVRSKAPEVVLPGSAYEVVLLWEDVPWVGTFRPAAVIRAESGDQRVQLARVWVFPPLPYLVALALAIAFGLVAWWRRRRAWQYELQQELQRDADAQEDEEWEDQDRGW